MVPYLTCWWKGHWNAPMSQATSRTLSQIIMTTLICGSSLGLPHRSDTVWRKRLSSGALSRWPFLLGREHAGRVGGARVLRPIYQIGSEAAHHQSFHEWLDSNNIISPTEQMDPASKIQVCGTQEKEGDWPVPLLSWRYLHPNHQREAGEEPWENIRLPELGGKLTKNQDSQVNWKPGYTSMASYPGFCGHCLYKNSHCQLWRALRGGSASISEGYWDCQEAWIASLSTATQTS